MGINRELDLHITRRQLFGLTAKGIGVGSARLAAGHRGHGGRRRGTRSQDGRPGRAAALRAEGQARHLPAPVRRPVAARSVRLQAACSTSFTGTRIPDSVRNGQRITGMTIGPDVASRGALDVQVRAARTRRAPGSASCCRTPRRSRTTSASSRSMNTEAINHDPAITFIQTGLSSPAGRAWARGSATASAARTRTCPAFVVLLVAGAGAQHRPAALLAPVGQRLPAVAATRACASARGRDPVLYLSKPAGRRRTTSRRQMLDDRRAARTRSTLEQYRRSRDRRRASRSTRWRTACRRRVPELMDLSKEPRRVFELYGPESRKPGTLRRELPARAAAGRARRALRPALPSRLGPAQRPAARPHEPVPRHRSADRGARHGSEAARPARRHARRLGRRVRPHRVFARASSPTPTTAAIIIRAASTMWMAGGGMKRGTVLRRDGRLLLQRRRAIPCHVHDLHATILHLLGIDHKRLTYKFQGRDFRLTDVHGEIVKKLLA